MRVLTPPGVLRNVPYARPVNPRTRAAGRTAITDAFAVRHGHGEPAVQVPAPEPPLPTIAAYRGADHWHLVTFGLTDQVAKTAGQPAQVSGFGHELTLVVPADDQSPPAWAFELLLGAARVCVAHGRPLHDGARMAPGGPVDGAASKLVACGVRTDPSVIPTSFPFGRFAFLQLVGVTDVEYRLMRRAGTSAVLDALARRDPLLRTDPVRG